MSEQLGICLNLRNLGISQYANYNFNSSCELNGVVLAASEDGIFSLDSADDDDGTHIDAFIETLVTDLGVANPKRMRRLILGYEANGTLKLTTTTNELRQRKTYVYPAGKDRLQGGGTASGRRDQKGRYWQYRIDNTDGCDFSIDSLEVIPTVLALRRR